MWDDPGLRRHVGRLDARIEGLWRVTQRCVTEAEATGLPSPLGSAVKLGYSELGQEIAKLGMRLLGRRALGADGPETARGPHRPRLPVVVPEHDRRRARRRSSATSSPSASSACPRADDRRPGPRRHPGARLRAVHRRALVQRDPRRHGCRGDPGGEARGRRGPLGPVGDRRRRGRHVPPVQPEQALAHARLDHPRGRRDHPRPGGPGRRRHRQHARRRDARQRARLRDPAGGPARHHPRQRHGLRRGRARTATRSASTAPARSCPAPCTARACPTSPSARWSRTSTSARR